MVFPDQILELGRLGVHHHGGPQKILHQGVIADERQLLNQDLVEVFARFFTPTFVKEKKILHFLRVRGLVGELLLDDQHAGQEKYRQR